MGQQIKSSFDSSLGLLQSKIVLQMSAEILRNSDQKLFIVFKYHFAKSIAKSMYMEVKY